MTWSYDNAPEIAPLDLIFVTTPAWRQLQARTRQGAQAETLALTARWYDRLAHIEAPQQAFFPRFYPQAVAVLDTAWREAGRPAPLAGRPVPAPGWAATKGPSEPGCLSHPGGRTVAAVRAGGGGGDTEFDRALAALYFELAQQAQHSSTWPASAQFLARWRNCQQPRKLHCPPARCLPCVRKWPWRWPRDNFSDGDLAAQQLLALEQVWGPTALTAPDAAHATRSMSRLPT